MDDNLNIHSSITNGISALKQYISIADNYTSNPQTDEESKYLYYNYLTSDLYIDNILYYQVMKLINDSSYYDFYNSSYESEFWENSDVLRAIESDIHLSYFLYEDNLIDNEHFLSYIQNIYKDQTNEGRIFNYPEDHIKALPILIATNPDSDNVKSAINYVIENGYEKFELFQTSLLLLSLTEFNNDEYEQIIASGLEKIKTGLQEYLDKKDYGREVETIYHIIKLFLRMEGRNSLIVKTCISYIVNNQNEDGSWGEKDKKANSYLLTTTCFALLSLLYYTPPVDVSYEELIFRERKHKININNIKPFFIHTSPLYNDKLHITGILKKVESCFSNVNKIIRIMTPYYDILYENIINIIHQNPDIEVRIISRPKKDIKGIRERIGKNVHDLLRVATKNNFKTSEIIHSRMIIIDDNELIVSSADLTREGLYDEFNAGIYTRNKDSIHDAINYFDNIWDLIELE